ncbi:carbohydrate binding domain-containing protein [Catelliglobosispora koreensis]|uniref:carbohydrate binding domain-containing protein n=1 Tax=Catelliglobosispora koreensis TaxID=129052 RepID=UPI0003674B22|nr:carbohydrate binding domain-containing protein [Catelliglobosispora koreensis]
MSRKFGLVLAAVVATAAIAVPAHAANTAYYVDCSAATNGTGTQASPWHNLATVNGRTFQQGDTVNFKRGATCNGQFKPLGSGVAGNPIKAQAYGTGTLRPVIAGGGTVYAAVHLYNVQQWEIRDLEVTNDAATAAERNGILVQLDNYGTGTHYLLSNVYVHHVKGSDAQNKLSNGIQFRVSGTAVPTRFHDVIVENSEIYHVDREGLTTRSDQMCRPIYGTGDGCGTTQNWLASTGVIFRNNLLHDIGGDGIVIRVTDHALVTGNVAHHINMRSAYNNAGIWTINTDYTTVEFNEVYRVRRPAGQNDGNAFDSDFGVRWATFQYNYSHDNEGGFILFCGSCGAGSSSTGTVVRYNVSKNDGSRLFFTVGEQSAQVYGNTFIMPAGGTTKVIEQNGSHTYLTLSNNIFHNTGTGGYGGSNYFPTDFTWRSNVFYGYHPANEPADPGKITADPLVGTDFRIPANSPAALNGVLISNNGGRDYFGNSVSGTCRPDIGAHQVSGGNCNLAANGGFETGSISPWTQYLRGVIDTSSPHSGSYNVKVGPYPGSVEQVVTVTPNTTYRLDGWGKVSSTDTQVVIGVKNYGGTETRAPAFTTSSYTYGSVTFTTGSTNTTARIYCYARVGTGYGYCDDITLTKL